MKSNSCDVPTPGNSLAKAVNAKFGSFAVKTPVASFPPWSLIPGSMPSANATEDDNPRRTRVNSQREIFTGKPSDSHTNRGTTRVSNPITNRDDRISKHHFFFQEVRDAEKGSI